MKYYRLDNETFETSIEAALQTLESGGIIVAPTETVYGVMTRWNNEEGKARIFDLKSRDSEKKLQVLVHDVEEIPLAEVACADKVTRIARYCWPGPLTLVVHPPAESEGKEENEGIGVRIPANDFLQTLLDRSPVPLSGTSANISGEKSPVTCQEAWKSLGDKPGCYIDGGPVTGGTPSTVAELTTKGIRLIREGPILRETLERL